MRRALALAVTGVLACTPSGSDDAADDADDDAGTTDAEIPTPVFISPAVGEFIVDTNQRAPEIFKLDRVIPGLTQVLLDALMLGTLAPGDPRGALTEDRLQLDLQGALLAGTHALQLVNPTQGGPLDSVTLTMVVEPPPITVRPTWRSELATTDITGTALLATGVGPGRLLAVLGPGDPDPILAILLPSDDGAWSPAAPITFPLEGHVPDAMSQRPAVAITFLPTAADAPPDRLRIAFRVGLPGAAILTRDISLADPLTIEAPQPAIDLVSALAGDEVEWAAFGRPFLLGDTLLAELLAPADTELAHPGDRRIVTSFWRGDDLRWTPPTQVGLPAPTDLDALGPAPIVDDIPRGRTSTLSLRLGGAYPGVLEASDDGAITITTPTRTASLPVPGAIDLATILGSFGGRTIAAIDTKGRIGLSLQTTSGDFAPRNASPPAGALPPDIAPTGPPAPGLGVGFPFFLVPYGDAAPVQLILSDGQGAAVVALDQPDPVHCDAVALAATLAGNLPDAPALPFACLSHGALRLGWLIPEPHEDAGE